MRIATALIGLLLAVVALTACSGSNGSDPYCEHLAAVSQRLASAEQDLFRGGATERAVSRIVGELQVLRKGAPDDIRTAVAELGTAFQQAEQALQRPTEQGRQQLAQIARVLSTDGKKISHYVTSKCR